MFLCLVFVFCLISQESYHPLWSWLDSRSCPGSSSHGPSRTASERYSEFLSFCYLCKLNLNYTVLLRRFIHLSSKVTSWSTVCPVCSLKRSKRVSNIKQFYCKVAGMNRQHLSNLWCVLFPVCLNDAALTFFSNCSLFPFTWMHF